MTALSKVVVFFLIRRMQSCSRLHICGYGVETVNPDAIFYLHNSIENADIRGKEFLFVYRRTILTKNYLAYT